VIVKVSMSKHGNLLLTRDGGRAVAMKLPKDREVELDFEGIDVAASSSLGSLIRTARARGVTLTIVGASERIQEKFERVYRLTEKHANE